jgi:hypothetical protein
LAKTYMASPLVSGQGNMLEDLQFVSWLVSRFRATHIRMEAIVFPYYSRKKVQNSGTMSIPRSSASQYLI